MSPVKMKKNSFVQTNYLRNFFSVLSLYFYKANYTLNMLKRICQNVAQSIEASPQLSDRWAYFSTLSRLNFKTKFLDKPQTLHSDYFFGFQVYSYSFLTLTYLFEEIFLRKDYFFTTQNTQPVIFDCGANIGVATLYFKHLYPQATVLCFEPNPSTFKLLEKNIHSNGLTNIYLHPIALSDFEGQTQFFCNDDAGTLLSSLDKNRGGEQMITCQVERLSHFLEPFKQVDCIKMDVEGGEWRIVNDLVTTGVLHKVQQLIIEYHHKIDGDKSHLSAFLNIFEQHGFEYNLKGEFDKVDSFQDVLIHFYKPNSI
jgi:FkbM family methyltransferase